MNFQHGVRCPCIICSIDREPRFKELDARLMAVKDFIGYARKKTDELLTRYRREQGWVTGHHEAGDQP